MGKVVRYFPVKLIMAVNTASQTVWSQTKMVLEEKFGEIDQQLPWYAFDHSNYYTAEMGENLQKCFISFAELIPADSLPDIKTWTNSFEDAYAQNDKRTINLDPGYLCVPKVVLATTKDYSHRLYLKDGIFGDIHLTVKGGKFQPNSWTYPDYRNEAVLTFFDDVRKIYLEQLAFVT